MLHVIDSTQAEHLQRAPSLISLSPVFASNFILASYQTLFCFSFVPMQSLSRLSFIKAHASGNDYVIPFQADFQKQVDLCNHLLGLGEAQRNALIQKLCQRRFSIGADGFLILHPGRISMNMFNPDGSEAEMCGNGLRCAALFFGKYFLKQTGQSQDSGGTQACIVTIPVQTKMGLKKCLVNLEIDEIECSMGAPRYSRDTEVQQVNKSDRFTVGEVNLELILGKEDTELMRTQCHIDDEPFLYCVSMGNPHAVIFVPDVDRVPIETWGPRIENHRIFSNRTNVEFVSIEDAKEGIVHQRTWERGAGETLSCGTGGAAVSTVCVLLSKIDNNEAHIHMRGGLVHYRCIVEADGSTNSQTGIEEVKLRGQAHMVYRGDISL
mmetsp:Transcript_6265/g.23548  ORF Transcript_6265/g.23548 Transcript_6265/m.23548 type:complete len:380 (+) Transcript_6265:1065-2204(+)